MKYFNCCVSLISVYAYQRFLVAMLVVVDVPTQNSFICWFLLCCTVCTKRPLVYIYIFASFFLANVCMYLFLYVVLLFVLTLYIYIYVI